MPTTLTSKQYALRREALVRIEVALAATGELDSEWRLRASCRGKDPDIFFPQPGGGRAIAVEAARQICSRCPVIRECHAFSKRSDYGVWAGELKDVEAERKRRGVDRRIRRKKAA